MKRITLAAALKYGIPSTSDEVRLTTLFLAFRE
jgi:hypothetical protein